MNLYVIWYCLISNQTSSIGDAARGQPIRRHTEEERERRKKRKRKKKKKKKKKKIMQSARQYVNRPVTCRKPARQAIIGYKFRMK